MLRHATLLHIETYPKSTNGLRRQDCHLDHATQSTKDLWFTYCAFGKTILQLGNAGRASGKSFACVLHVPAEQISACAWLWMLAEDRAG
jgi:hypothetical protein